MQRGRFDKTEEKKGDRAWRAPLVDTAVMLPRDLIEALKSNARTADQNVSAEIRRRVQLSYDQEGRSRDPETANLVEAIERLADNIASTLATNWHQHRYPLAVLSPASRISWHNASPVVMKAYLPTRGYRSANLHLILITNSMTHPMCWEGCTCGLLWPRNALKLRNAPRPRNAERKIEYARLWR